MPEYPRHLRAFDYIGLHRYFLTFCTFERRPHFLQAANVDIAHDQILRAAVANKFSIHTYCYMPEHVHLVVEAEHDDCDLKCFVARAKQYSGFHFKRATASALWQRYGYERVLRNEESTIAVARYVIENPVRAGMVASPADYPFWGSSTWSRDELLEHVRRAG